jgi:hypothetical protein
MRSGRGGGGVLNVTFIALRGLVARGSEREREGGGGKEENKKLGKKKKNKTNCKKINKSVGWLKRGAGSAGSLLPPTRR